MLGKASEIKTAHISTVWQRFEKHLEWWKSSNPDVEILDIKFSVVPALPGKEDRAHALIIYKEAKEDERE